MNTPRRGHYLIIFQKSSFFSIIAGLIYLVFTIMRGNFSTDDFMPLIILWSGFIGNTIKYFNTTFYVENDTLKVATGLFTKKKIEMPLRNITTIDLSQDILYRIFKVYKVKIDNGSQGSKTTDSAEFSVALPAEEAFELKRTLSGNTEQITEETGEAIKPFITAEIADFIKLGLIQSKLQFLAIAGPIIVAIFSLISFIANENVDNFETALENAFTGAFASAFIIIAIIMLLVFPTIISIVSSLIIYYNYRVTKHTDNILVEYGFFNKRKYTLQLNKINGVVLKQNLFMQFLGFYSIEVRIIGYGDNKADGTEQTQSLLFPIAKLDKAKWIINSLLPAFDTDFKVEKSPKRAYRFYFTRPLYIIAILASLFLFIKINWLPGLLVAVLVILMTVSKLFQIKNSGIGLAKKTLILANGGFHKDIHLLKTNTIENIAGFQSFFKKRKNITDLHIGYMAPKTFSNLVVKNVEDNSLRKLERLLNF